MKLTEAGRDAQSEPRGHAAGETGHHSSERGLHSGASTAHAPVEQAQRRHGDLVGGSRHGEVYPGRPRR